MLETETKNRRWIKRGGCRVKRTLEWVFPLRTPSASVQERTTATRSHHSRGLGRLKRPQPGESRSITTQRTPEMTNAVSNPSVLRRLGANLMLATAACATGSAALLGATASAAEPAVVASPRGAVTDPYACLETASDVVRVAGRHENKYVTVSAKGRAFDARSAVFLIGKERHGMITSHGGASDTGMCWAGGYFHSEKPWNASWDDHKDLDGPTRNSSIINNESQAMTVTGLHFFNVHDGPRSTNSLDWRVEHVWGEYVRDDCIENDHFSTGEVRDSLFDGCYTGISTRPSSAASGEDQVVTLDKVLLRLHPMPYPYKWRTKGESIDERGDPYSGNGIPYGHGKFFKYEERSPELNNHFVIKDSVFAAGFANIDGRKLNLPNPGLIDRCEGVVIAWLGDGRFPGDASVAAVGRKFPKCVTVLEGQAARDFWREKVSDWHRRHPDVGRDRKPADPGAVVFPLKF